LKNSQFEAVSDSESECESDDYSDLKEQLEDMERDEDEDVEELKTRNEMELPTVEPIVIEVPENAVLSPVGTVHGVVDRFVIIQGYDAGDVKVLDCDTVVFLSDKTIVGAVFDVFGPVTNPMYSVLFNSKDEIYYIPDLAKFVYTNEIKTKGTDASNFYDEETEEQEFSDDEAERMHKSKSKKNMEDGEIATKKNKKKRGNRQQQPQQYQPQQQYPPQYPPQYQPQHQQQMQYPQHMQQIQDQAMYQMMMQQQFMWAQYMQSNYRQ
jgi:H/ACA ribonucleoprotein complex non-core subunit NAF1